MNSQYCHNMSPRRPSNSPRSTRLLGERPSSGKSLMASFIWMFPYSSSTSRDSKNQKWINMIENKCLYMGIQMLHMVSNMFKQGLVTVPIKQNTKLKRGYHLQIYEGDVKPIPKKGHLPTPAPEIQRSSSLFQMATGMVPKSGSLNDSQCWAPNPFSCPTYYSHIFLCGSIHLQNIGPGALHNWGFPSIGVPQIVGL